MTRVSCRYGTGMAVYVYGKAWCHEEAVWLGWTADADKAAAQADSYRERYVDGAVMTLADDGSVEITMHHRVPQPYTGPTVRARVSYMNQPGYAHRVPVDCARPHLYELDEDHLWRVVGTSVMPTIDSPEPSDFWTCRCGEWQEIEGEPNAVAEMVAKHPVE